VKCINGHDVDAGFSYCPVCDAKMHPLAPLKPSIVATQSKSPVQLTTCPRGHVLAVGTTVCPLCKALDRDIPSPPDNKLLPFVYVIGLMVVAGIIIIASAWADWIVASGPYPHSWNAFNVGDLWDPLQGVQGAAAGVGAFVIFLGIAYIVLGAVSATPLMQYGFVRARAAFAIAGGIPFFCFLYALRQTAIAISTFNSASPDPFFGSQIPGETATYGPGIWIFLAGVALGTVGGALHFVHQLQSAKQLPSSQQL